MHNTIIATLMTVFMVWVVVQVTGAGIVRVPSDYRHQFEKKSDCDKQAKATDFNRDTKHKCVKVAFVPFP